MRPYTAESNQIFLPSAIRWRNRSNSPKNTFDYANKQVRNLMQSSNVNAFIGNSITTLEASNFSLLNGRKEILDQLTFIKNQFNLTKKRFSMGDTQVKELERISNEKIIEEQRAKTSSFFLNEKTKNLYNVIDYIKTKQQEAEQDMLVYMHILERTRNSHIFLELRANNLKRYIRKQNIIADIQQRIMFKSVETRTSSQRTYRYLHKSITADTKEKYSIIQKLSRDLGLRDSLIAKREERKKRFLEISENAENEHRDRRNTDLREGAILNRL